MICTVPGSAVWASAKWFARCKALQMHTLTIRKMICTLRASAEWFARLGRPQNGLHAAKAYNADFGHLQNGLHSRSVRRMVCTLQSLTNAHFDHPQNDLQTSRVRRMVCTARASAEWFARCKGLQCRLRPSAEWFAQPERPQNGLHAAKPYKCTL